MQHLDNRGMSLARRLCSMQIVAGCAAALTCYVVVGPDSARAALVGALAAAAPAFFFAWRALSPAPGSSPYTVLRAMYRGEAGKLVLTGVLFGLGVKFYAQHPLALLLTFMGCLAVYWGGMMYLLSDRDHHGRS